MTDHTRTEDDTLPDVALSRRLTESIRAISGVTGVYPAQPILEAAADAIAVRLDLRQPDVLVDIDRADDFTTVSAHIATAASLPTPETVRTVGELLWRLLETEETITPGRVAVNVKVRLVEDSGQRAASAAESVLTESV